MNKPKSLLLAICVISAAAVLMWATHEPEATVLARNETVNSAQSTYTPIPEENKIAPSADRSASPAGLSPVRETPRQVQASPAQPIPLSSYHAEMLRPTPEQEKQGQQTVHQVLESQQKDTTWSWQAETDLKQHFVADGIQVLGIECRTTMCEVQAIGAGPDASKNWQDTLNSINSQPWWSSFGGKILSSSEPKDGKEVLTAYIIRKQP